MTEQEFQTFLRSIRPADRAAMDAAARRQAELKPSRRAVSARWRISPSGWQD